MTTMTIISTHNAEHYRWGQQCDGWHLVKTDRLSIIQEHVPAGGAEVRHHHEKANQFFFVLSGQATLEVDGKIHTLHAEEGLYVRAGVPHQLRNDSSTPLRFIVTSSPPSHGDRIEINL